MTGVTQTSNGRHSQNRNKTIILVSYIFITIASHHGSRIHQETMEMVSEFSRQSVAKNPGYSFSKENDGPVCPIKLGFQQSQQRGQAKPTMILSNFKNIVKEILNRTDCIIFKRCMLPFMNVSVIDRFCQSGGILNESHKSWMMEQSK